MLSSLILGLGSLALSEAAPRPALLDVCPPASTVTSFLPIITTIPECQGSLCGTNTVIAQGQTLTFSTLSSFTATGSIGDIFGGSIATNTGASISTIAYPTFTVCDGQCTVAGSVYTDATVYYPGSVGVAPSATATLGGQALSAPTQLVTVAIPSTSAFYNTVFSGTTITVGAQPITTTSVGVDGSATTVIQPASQLIPGSTGLPATQTVTVITAGATSPSTVTVTVVVSTGSNGLPSTSVVGTTPTGAAGALPNIPVTTVTSDVSSLLSSIGAVQSDLSSALASVSAGAPAAASSAPASATFGAGVSPTTTRAGITTSDAAAMSTTIPCSSSAACSAIGLNLCVALDGTPITDTTQLGVCVLSPAATTAPVTPSATPVPCTTSDQCSQVGLGLCLDALGATIGTNVGLLSGTCAAVSGTQPTQTGAGSAPTATQVSCTSSQQCSTLGLGLCLDLLGSAVTTGTGLCVGTLPTIPGYPSVTIPTISASIGVSGTVTIPATLPTGSLAAITLAASDLLQEAITDAPSVSSILSGLINAGTATVAATQATRTSVSCADAQQCAQLGLGICVEALNVLGAEAGICALPAAGSVPTISLGAGVSNVLTATIVSPSTTLPTGVIPQATGLARSCTSNADCTDVGLNVCVNLVNAIGINAGVCGASDISATVTGPAGAAATVPALGTPTQSTTACKTNDDCALAGLGACVNLLDLVGVNAGVCAIPITAGSTGLAGASVSVTIASPTIDLPAVTVTGITQPSTSTTTCTSNADCTALGLGLCVNLVDVLGVQTGVCALSTSGNNVGVTVTATQPAITLPTTTGTGATNAQACTTDDQCTALGLGLCIDVVDVLGATTKACAGSIVSGGSAGVSASATVSANIPLVTTTVPATTGTSCQTSQDCAALGLGLCVDIVNVAGAQVGVCAAASPDATAPQVSVTAGAVVSPSTLLTVTVPASTTTPATAAPVSCQSTQDCLNQGKTLCTNLSGGVIVGGTVITPAVGVCI